MPQPYLRSALFVDFDNIYSGLERTSREAAQRFAREPARWIGWLERLPVPGDEGLRRRVLVRRCYLNPRRYNLFRPYFIRSAFEVVDCPPLTSQGKTSADVMMVLDVVDALNHPTRFDEFIVFSGDADFTPVLLRLRKHDRRTAVLTVGPASGAYRAASDLLLAEETFVEDALGVAEPADAAAPLAPAGNGHGRAPRAPRSLLEAIARRLHRDATLAGSLEPWNLPALYKEFPEFTRGEDWLGYYSLRALTEAVVAAHGGLELVTGEDEEWWVATRREAGGEGGHDGGPDGGAGEGPEEGADGEREGGGVAAARRLDGDRDGAGDGLDDGGHLDDGGDGGARGAGEQRRELARYVRQRVGEAPEPVVLATLAQEVRHRFGDAVQSGRWQGAGSFKALLESLDLGELCLSAAGPGCVYHPERHGPVREPDGRDHFAESHPDLAELARAVHDVTDTPYLSPEQYAAVLAEIAGQVNEDGLHLTRTSKAVRDRVHGRGVSVARSDVTFLLKGLTFSGFEPRPGEETAATVGRRVVRNTVELARRAQMDLDDTDEDRIGRWILGALTEEGEDAAPEPSSPLLPSPPGSRESADLP